MGVGVSFLLFVANCTFFSLAPIPQIGGKCCFDALLPVHMTSSFRSLTDHSAAHSGVGSHFCCCEQFLGLLGRAGNSLFSPYSHPFIFLTFLRV
jgi:hypothetical protein